MVRPWTIDWMTSIRVVVGSRIWRSTSVDMIRLVDFAVKRKQRRIETLGTMGRMPSFCQEKRF